MHRNLTRPLLALLALILASLACPECVNDLRQLDIRI